LAKSTLKNQSKSKQMKQQIFKQYALYVCKSLGVDVKSLFTKLKRRNLVDARYLLYYFCFNRPMRIRDIQEYMSDEGYFISHSAIIKGIAIINDRIENDKDYSDLVKKINNEAKEARNTRPSI
jgi:chromosomal replication initiation ATPase DnaA